MTTTHTAKGIVWIDLQSPSDEDISSLVNRYSLHPLVGEELRNTPSLSKISFHKEYILVVLTFPVRAKQNGSYAIVDREVDFVIGKNFLITAHADAIEQLEYFAKIFETNTILNKDSKIENTGHLFYFMVMRLYAGMFEDLENIRDTLMNAEDSIFQDEERKMVTVLSKLSRELIDFRETVLIQNSRELVSELRETNDSLLNTKQNDIIRTLTIVTFIFYPATFIASLFTIPAKFVPLVDSDAGWLMILGCMIAITVGITVVLKKKRWL